MAARWHAAPHAALRRATLCSRLFSGASILLPVRIDAERVAAGCAALLRDVGPLELVLRFDGGERGQSPKGLPKPRGLMGAGSALFLRPVSSRPDAHADVRVGEGSPRLWPRATWTAGLSICGGPPRTATNNTAEYIGLCEALRAALAVATRAASLHAAELGRHRSGGGGGTTAPTPPISALRIEGDSELVLKQVRGLYRCNPAHLDSLRSIATHLLRSVVSALRLPPSAVTLANVRRVENGLADTLANAGIAYASALSADPAVSNALLLHALSSDLNAEGLHDAAAEASHAGHDVMPAGGRGTEVDFDAGAGGTRRRAAHALASDAYHTLLRRCGLAIGHSWPALSVTRIDAWLRAGRELGEAGAYPEKQPLATSLTTLLPVPLSDRVLECVGLHAPPAYAVVGEGGEVERLSSEEDREDAGAARVRPGLDSASTDALQQRGHVSPPPPAPHAGVLEERCDRMGGGLASLLAIGGEPSRHLHCTLRVRVKRGRSAGDETGCGGPPPRCVITYELWGASSEDSPSSGTPRRTPRGQRVVKGSLGMLETEEGVAAALADLAPRLPPALASVLLESTHAAGAGRGGTGAASSSSNRGRGTATLDCVPYLALLAALRGVGELRELRKSGGAGRGAVEGSSAAGVAPTLALQFPGHTALVHLVEGSTGSRYKGELFESHQMLVNLTRSALQELRRGLGSARGMAGVHS